MTEKEELKAIKEYLIEDFKNMRETLGQEGYPIMLQANNDIRCRFIADVFMDIYNRDLYEEVAEGKA